MYPMSFGPPAGITIWAQGYYDPNANVWNLGSCIPNTAWSNHQRIRQYEGDHDELWGGLILAIDSNVLDGVVAVPHISPVEVKIGARSRGTYKFVPHQVRQQSFTNINNGPVKIFSSDNTSLIASQRIIYKATGGVDVSSTEMMGLPDSQLDNIYWLPWYNNKDLDTQLRFANVSDATPPSMCPSVGRRWRAVPSRWRRVQAPGRASPASTRDR